jgi:beta-lactamase superfamily II metal-dependent hydrolase
MDWLGSGLAWASSLPLAVATLPAPAWWAAALALAGTVWLLLPRGFPLRALGLVLWLPLLFPLRDAIAPDHFRADVIDVGQGTAVLIRTANHALLYDTGASFADSDSGERIIVPYLRASGIGELTGLIVSHADNDHSGGMRSVLRDIPTGWLLHGMPASQPAARCCAGGSPVRARPALELGRRAVRDAQPHARGLCRIAPPHNDFSCVLRVSTDRHSLLLTGDGERRTELELLESGLLAPVNVLLAGHHGSRTSSIPEFVAATRPEWVVFTQGYRNRYGHPHPQVVARFRDIDARLLRSDYDGLIRLDFGEAGVEASQYRPYASPLLADRFLATMNETVRPRCFEATDLETARQALARVLPVAENHLPWQALEHAHQRLGASQAFAHSVGTALIVAELRVGADAVAAALLQDCLDASPEFDARFGTAARLARGVAAMARIETLAASATDKRIDPHAQLEALRQMVLAMVEDIRVVLVKLAERTHALRCAASQDAATREALGQQARELFAPLANRLGVWQIKWEMEDWAFRYLEPDTYKSIAAQLDEKRADREAYIGASSNACSPSSRCTASRRK